MAQNPASAARSASTSTDGPCRQKSRASAIDGAGLGAFLGSGYGTMGFKPGNKLGHHFWGKFDPA